MLGWAGSRRLAMADKWLTFDCYGTVADWNTCMCGALEAIAGSRRRPAVHRVPPG